jgi:hypothetical protein
MKEKNEKKIENCDEISKLIKAFPKDIAALETKLIRDQKLFFSGQKCILTVIKNEERD